MNKTIVFVTFAVLVGLAIVGSAILLVVRPDASATFVTNVVQLLGMVTLAAGTFAGLGKLTTDVEKVRSQTNGTLSKLSTERDAALAELARRDGQAAAQLIVASPTVIPDESDPDAPRHRL